MFSGVLDERRPTSRAYDAASDTLRLVLSESRTPGAPGESASKRAATAALLLDAAGFLVGVDVGTEAMRIVVMLGPHESVASTRESGVEIVESDGDLREVRVPHAKASCRANEASPYA